MRRNATWLIIGALATLVVAAVVDSYYGGVGPLETETQSPATVAEQPGIKDLENDSALVAALERVRVSGVLYLSDEECRVQAIELPSLKAEGSLSAEFCVFSLSPDGHQAVQRGVWRPQGDAWAVCRQGSVRVVSRDGDILSRLPGCDPAWKPNGTLTYVREGELIALTRAGTSDALSWSQRDTVPLAIFSREHLAEALRGRRSPVLLRSYSIVEASWLDDYRFAALIQGRFEKTIAVVDQRGDLAAIADETSIPSGALEALQASPEGGYIAIRQRSGEIQVFDDTLAPVSFSLPPGTTIRAIAWSPDERWTGVATQGSVFLFSTARPSAHPIRLPIAANDLAWR